MSSVLESTSELQKEKSLSIIISYLSKHHHYLSGFSTLSLEVNVV